MSSAWEGRGIRAFYVRPGKAQTSASVPWSPLRHSPYKQEVGGSIPSPPMNLQTVLFGSVRERIVSGCAKSGAAEAVGLHPIRVNVTQPRRQTKSACDL